MYRERKQFRFSSVIRQTPGAFAIISGGAQYPDIDGVIRLYQTPNGVLTVTEIYGLPISFNSCQSRIFAIHIHEGAFCSGNAADQFYNVGSHYNPYGCPHPYHSGDMPPLFTSGNMAFSAFLTDRFRIEEIIGKTVIIHDRPDDFTTQPAGNAGNKIACGEIQPNTRRIFRI